MTEENTPTVPNRKPEDLKPSLSLRLLFPVIKILVGLFLRFKFKAPQKVFRKERVPKDQGLLIFANHISNTDPILIQIACPRLINFLARRDLFARDDIGKFITWWCAFPVTQSSPDTGAIKTAVTLAKQGHAVCMFPEGQLSPDGNLLDLFPGAALLVRKAGVPAICVGLKNTNKLMPHPEETARPAHDTLTATWGHPKQFDPKAKTEDIMAWIESELLTLSDQPSRNPIKNTPEAEASEVS